jgi:hypothetical protein
MRSTAIQGAVIGASLGLVPGSLFGPQDGIPTIPFGFVHPGFRPLTLNIRPEAGGRPYSLDNVRRFYGVSTKTRYRDIQTWPFSDEVTVVDGVPIKSETTFDTRNHPVIKKIVEYLTKSEMPVVDEVKLPAPKEDLTVRVPEGVSGDADEDPTGRLSQEEPLLGKKGGGWTVFNRTQKNKYSKNTQTHIPNFLSVEGNHRAHIFAHAEYFGMFYLGVFRLAGMLNPVPHSANKCAFFEMFPNGMKIQYIERTMKGGRGGTRRSGHKVRGSRMSSRSSTRKA